MQEILLKKKYFERGLSKDLKKVNFIFPLDSSAFKIDKIRKNKMGLELVTCRRPQNMFRKLLYFLWSIYPTKFDGVI